MLHHCGGESDRRFVMLLSRAHRGDGGGEGARGGGDDAILFRPVRRLKRSSSHAMSINGDRTHACGNDSGGDFCEVRRNALTLKELP